VTSGLFGAVAVQVLHQEWTRTDEAHVAAEHVPEFGEFVERGGAEPAAEGCQPLRVGEKAS